ncbi:hypothetical protein D6T70_06810 [Kurthia gibsonii]|uniref:hypothetical protein n=1 Tax=Kurthia gibsonii TaxID=33946 RepID=UPI000EB5906E|nr:hypothetical protein [Kurthia gibsonii]RXH52230.1 hypothetical protein D6T70_06810 [Kurthia gibsonii]
MNKRKKYAENETEELLKNGAEYLEELEITERDFKNLSTPQKRTGSMGKTKAAWRVSDGIDYPVITYKASDLKEGLTHE